MAKYKVYIVNGGYCPFINITDSSNEKFKEEATRQENVYSLKKFHLLFNSGVLNVDSNIDYIRILKENK